MATAIDTDSVGYWAGTTTVQRQALLRSGVVSVAQADTQAAAGEPTHLVGQGSLRSYRRDRCRCLECKQCNAAARVMERGRERVRAAGVVIAA